jgi:DNA-binding NarL/FixJ family response regulator
MPLRIFLADDHVVVRQGLKALLQSEGFQVVGEASDGHTAVQLIPSLNADVAVLDVGMPLMNGIETASELQKSWPKVKCILLTLHDEDQYVKAALLTGIRGYVLKSQTGTDLVQAIHNVMRGRIYLSPGISQAVVDALANKSGQTLAQLSRRERQVLQLIGEGKSTKEVATLLRIGVKTAESHRSRLMQKLDIHEVASLVRYAIRMGVIEP